MTTELAIWRRNAFKQLESVSDEADIEIFAILEDVLSQNRAWILTHGQYELNRGELARLDQYSARLARNEPLAYILGRKEFFAQPFRVTPDVLIPRPETEILVEEAIHWALNQKRALDFIDVGTGSGCILVSVAQRINPRLAIGLDFSLAALKVAKGNCDLLSRHLFNFMNGNLLEAVHHRFDLVCANLPYIPTKEVDSLAHIKFEPRLALEGGQEGSELILRLLQQLPGCLKQPGLALLEMEYDQAEILMTAATLLFPNGQVSIVRDYAGHDRILRIELPSEC